MQVDTSRLSPPDQIVFAQLSGTPGFYKDLERFVRDNPIGIQRGMDWNRRRVIGTLEGETLYITRVN